MESDDNRGGLASVQVGRGQIQRVPPHHSRNTTTSTTLQPRQSSIRDHPAESVRLTAGQTGNPARRGSAKYYTVQVRPFNQADSSYRPPHSPPRSGLFRLQGIFTAAGCAHSAWTIVCRTAGLAEEMPFKRLGHSSASYGIDLSGSTAGNTPEPVPPASATRKTYEDSLPDSMSVP